jgi:hypothetical protein
MRRKTMDRFTAVQDAAKRRGSLSLNTEALAQQILAAAGGDARLAYDFLDTLNAHVTRALQER